MRTFYYDIGNGESYEFEPKIEDLIHSLAIAMIENEKMTPTKDNITLVEEIIATNDLHWEDKIIEYYKEQLYVLLEPKFKEEYNNLAWYD